MIQNIYGVLGYVFMVVIIFFGFMVRSVTGINVENGDKNVMKEIDKLN